MRAHPLILLALVVAACGSEPPQAVRGETAAARAERKQAVQEVARRTTQAVENRSVALSCNESHAPPQLSQALIVPARQCYGCDAVGYAIRRIKEASAKDLWVLTAKEDAGEVCRYLRRERIRAPVALLPDNVLSTEVNNDLTYFNLSGDSGSIRIVEGRNGSALLLSLAINDTTQKRVP